MMVSPLSGSNNEIELVKIETEELSLTIKGNPYHEKYESLKEYHAMNADEMMYFHVDGKVESVSVSVFDARLQRLDEGNEHPPIFLKIEVISLLLFRKITSSSLFIMNIQDFENKLVLFKWDHFMC